MKKTFSVKSLVTIGMMTAIVFLFTQFLGIRIPTPAGTVMLKTANIVMLIAGMVFGGIPGGLAAGLGSALFDLTFPEYAPAAPITFVRFFIMGATAGFVANIGKPEKITYKRAAVAATLGALLSYMLYLGENIGGYMLAGSTMEAALIANSTKLIASGVNVVIAVVFATILTPNLQKRLKQNHILPFGK